LGELFCACLVHILYLTACCALALQDLAEPESPFASAQSDSSWHVDTFDLGTLGLLWDDLGCPGLSCPGCGLHASDDLLLELGGHSWEGWAGQDDFML
jgi:hypothetical protein